MATRTRPMPDLASASNALYRGEARDFLEAMELVREECRDEQAWNAAARREATLNPAEGDGHYLAQLATSDAELEAYARLAGDARAIWLEEQARARERVAERLRAHGAPEMNDFAAALEADDYSELAI